MADATRADSVPFDAMKVMLAFQRLKRQTRGAGLCHWDLGRRMPTTNLSLGCRPCGEFHAGRAVLLVLAQLSFLPFDTTASF